MQIKLKKLSKKQTCSGFILVTCLLILFMLTMLATSAFKTAFMQTLIANNFRFQTVSFNNAENALIAAEKIIETNVANVSVFDFSAAGDGFYNTSENLDVKSIDWTDDSFVESGTATGDKYVVHYLGKHMLPGADQSAKGNGKSLTGSHIYAFKVTGRSTGAKHAERIVQSVYLTSEPP